MPASELMISLKPSSRGMLLSNTDSQIRGTSVLMSRKLVRNNSSWKSPNISTKVQPFVPAFESWLLRSSLLCTTPGRLAGGNWATRRWDSCCSMGTLHRKNVVSTSLASLASTTAVKVSCTPHTPGSSWYSKAPSAAISMHCRETWYASKCELPSSSNVTFTVTKGVSLTPSAASSCSSAAVRTSVLENRKPSSRGGWEKIHPTRSSRSRRASSATRASAGSPSPGSSNPSGEPS
mmetsp:Transcript_6669/g.9267  ORF Transcript_6669/g.9267 Transcript_6669/m.9267 type:complete len:235 (-) Transcript_6669:85-789(-)